MSKKVPAPRPFARRLVEDDSSAWRLVAEAVVPRVLIALRNRFGSSRGWCDGAVMSAVGVALDRLRKGEDPALAAFDVGEFEGWLVHVAANKLRDQLRKAQLEQDRQAQVYERQASERPADEPEVRRAAAAEIVADIEKCLTDDAGGLPGQVGRAGRVRNRQDAQALAAARALRLGARPPPPGSRPRRVTPPRESPKAPDTTQP